MEDILEPFVELLFYGLKNVLYKLLRINKGTHWLIRFIVSTFSFIVTFGLLILIIFMVVDVFKRINI